MANARLGWFSPLGATFRFGVCRSASWPSGSRLPFFGMSRFGVALVGLVLPPSASEIAAGRVGLRAHGFRFSACAASGLPLGGLVLPPSASEIAARRVGLRAHRFGVAAGRVDLRASVSAFRHAPLRGCPRRVGSSAFRFGVALGGLVLLPSVSELPLGGLAFWLTASAFRHAPLRGCCSAGWPSGSRLPLFGMRRSAPPCRRREDRRSTPTRHLFHFKTLIPTC